MNVHKPQQFQGYLGAMNTFLQYKVVYVRGYRSTIHIKAFYNEERIVKIEEHVDCNNRCDKHNDVE